MLIAVSAKTNVLLKWSDALKSFKLERQEAISGKWLTLTASGFSEDTSLAAVPVQKEFWDKDVRAGVYQYRIKDIADDTAPYEVSMWVRCGETGPIGYTFGNYRPPEELWGDIVTPDDLNRYHKSADLKTRKIKEGKIWSSTIKNLRNRHCYCQMR